MFNAKRLMAGAAIALVVGASAFAANSAGQASAYSLTGYFTEISGLGYEQAVLEYQEGGENTKTHRFTTRTSPFKPVALEDELDADEEDFDIN